MASFNLKNVQPNVVTSNRAGSIITIYGSPGCGKTTFASQIPLALLLACERGYLAIPGIRAVDITRWTDLKDILRQLKDPDVKGLYQTIVIDTVDVMTTYLEKYVCNTLEIENMGDGGWSKNSWAKAKRWLEEFCRSIQNLGYSLVFISHSKDKTFKRKDGSEYNQIVPTCPTAYSDIFVNMSDIVAYINVEEGTRKMVLRSDDDSVLCKCRYKYVDSEVDFSYEALMDALDRAIAKEAAEHENKFITNEAIAPVTETEYDYDALMNEFQTLAGQLTNKDANFYGPRIVAIIERTLGRGKKINDTVPSQADLVHQIVEDIKDELIK